MVRSFLSFYEKNLLNFIFVCLAVFPFWGQLSLSLIFIFSLLNVLSWKFSPHKLDKIGLVYLSIILSYVLGFSAYELILGTGKVFDILSINLGMAFSSTFFLVNRTQSKSIEGLNIKSASTVLTLFLIGLLGIWQCEWLTRVGLGAAFFQNANCVDPTVRYFSSNSLMVASMLLVLGHLALVKSENTKRNYLGFLSYILSFALLFFILESRGGALAFLCMTPFVFVYAIKSYGFQLKSFIYGIGLIIIVLSVFGLKFSTSREYQRLEGAVTQALNFDTSKNMDSTAFTRVVTFTAAVEAIKNNPFLGYGYSNRFNAIKPYLKVNIGTHGHPNNVVLNHLVAGGIFGLAILLLLFIYPLFIIIKFGKSYTNFFVPLVIFLSFFGNGMTTAVLGHHIHGTFWGMAFVFSLMVTLVNKKNDHFGAQ